MKEDFLSCIGEIKNMDIVLQNLSNLSSIPLEELDLENLNERAKDKKYFRYFTEDVKEIYEETDSKIKYLWFDSGLTCSNEKIYVSFVRLNTKNVGAYVGIEERLRHSCLVSAEKNKEKVVENNISLGSYIVHGKDKSKYVDTVFLEELYKRLLVPDNWTIASLGTYILALQTRLTRSYGLQDSEYLILNKDGTKGIINTCLLDTYSREIHLVVDIVDNTFKNYSLKGANAYLGEFGFSKKSLTRKVQGVKFYNSIDELVFTGSTEDFDLEDYRRLNHIIDGRRYRFPESARELPTDVISSRLVYAVELAIKISKYDSRYIAPMYSINDNSIQYLIPFHVNTSLRSKPELAIIVSKKNGFYGIMTVVTREQAYYNSRLISLYSSEWLIP